MSSELNSGGGPILRLLARGLEIWLRQQCSALERIEIELLGSTGKLLGGRLDGVRVTARRVVYQALEIESVELCSEAIRVRMGSLLRSQNLELEQPFKVRGSVVFSGEGLSRSLGTPRWRSLGDGLAEALLGVTPLAAVRIDGDLLVLSSMPAGCEAPVERAAQVSASGGTVRLQAAAQADASSDDNLDVHLPMDDNISIERVEVAAGLLELQGEARVSP
jgi:hypothetical protein